MTVKLVPFDPAGGSDNVHSWCTVTTVRGETVAWIELGVPLTTIYRMAERAPEKLKAWEAAMRDLATQIAAESP